MAVRRGHSKSAVAVDHEPCRPLPAEMEEQLRAGLTKELSGCQAVLVSDYTKGVCTPHLMQTVNPDAYQRLKNDPAVSDPLGARLT